jgi:hypothetical protein
MAHTTNKMFFQFEHTFSAYKGPDTKTYLFDCDEEIRVGVTVLWHADSADNQGARVDADCVGGQRYCYTVPVGKTVLVFVTVAPGAPEMLLTPVLRVGGVVHSTYPAEKVNAGDLCRMPINLEMDSGEENVWVLRDENGKQVLAIVVCGE